MISLCATLLAACGRLDFAPYDVPDAPPDDSSLHVHLTFDDGTFHDSSGYGHDATCGGACSTPIGGHVGAGAMAFDGTQCLHIADAIDLRPPAFTFAAWATSRFRQPVL
jgi:hypothetical protein